MVLLLILTACATSSGDSSGGQTVETQTWPSGWEYQGVCFAHVSDDSDCVYTSDGDEHPLDDADSIKVVTCDADDVAEGWDCIYDALNDLGEDGWELVPTSQDVFMFDYDIVYTLKRPLWD